MNLALKIIFAPFMLIAAILAAILCCFIVLVGTPIEIMITYFTEEKY